MVHAGVIKIMQLPLNIEHMFNSSAAVHAPRHDTEQQDNMPQCRDQGVVNACTSRGNRSTHALSSSKRASTNYQQNIAPA